jgi:putative transposase
MYKQKGNRHFWARGYCVDTVGRNEEEIKRYIQNQNDEYMREDGIK